MIKKVVASKNESSAFQHVLRKVAFVLKETQLTFELSQKTRYPSVARARSHTSAETFLDSSAPSYNFYPKVSIFDLQSNQRASALELTLDSARYIERHITFFAN